MAVDTDNREERGEATSDRAARLRPVLMTLIGLAFSVVLLLTGGRWDWIEGWLVAGIFTAYLVGTSLWAARYAPGLSGERARAVHLTRPSCVAVSFGHPIL